MGKWLRSYSAGLPRHLLGGLSTIGLLFIANLPQILFSFAYLLYNGIVTSMFLSQEYLSYAKHLKPLRVSEPTEEQSSSYFLSIPLRYATPLMLASGVLSWLISQALFLAQVNVRDFTGALDDVYYIQTCGWSALALVLTLALSGFLILVLLAFGFRRYESGMPMAGSCSMAISAAFHGVDGRKEDTKGKVGFGILGRDCDGVEKVGFGEVVIGNLVAGQSYF